MKNREKIANWLDAPTTPFDAWETWTYEKIAEHSGISYTGIAMNLVIVVAERRGIPVDEVEERRKNVWQERAGRVTAEKIARLKAYRRQDPPLSVKECAVRLGCSFWSVSYHCRKHKL